MFSITLITMGKLKEKFYTAAAEEYSKRLRAFADFRIVELPEYRLPDDPNETQIAQNMVEDHFGSSNMVALVVPAGDYEKEAELLEELESYDEIDSTMGLAALHSVKTGGRSAACFLIGSSFGIDPSIKAMADLKLSMSKMTFPHHLARVMALEQLYRAEAIQAGSKYHK